ncbi:MAG: GumC family protein [Spirulina sp.]
MPSPLISRYLLALDRYKWPALASLLGVLGLSTVVALQPPPPPVYRTEGMLVMNAPVVALTATGTEVQERGQGIISTEFLLADVLLDQVAKELARREISLSSQAIRDSTTLKLEGEENVVQRVVVVVKRPSAEEAQIVSDLLVEGMVELSRVTNRARLRAIITALDDRLPAVEADLRAAEQALETYDRQEGPAIQAALDGSLLGAISGGQQQQRQNQITLAGLDSQIQSLQRQLGLTPGEALTASALSADPIIAQLRAQILQTETQLQLLAPTLRAAHPTIQELQTSLAAYNRLLAERASEVVGGEDLAALPSVSQVRQRSALDPARAALANQLVVLSNQREALLRQQQILVEADGQLRQQYASLPNKQLERNRLAQQVARTQALYDQIQARRIDAESAEAETVSSLTVAQPPITALQPQDVTSPLVVVALGGVMGVIAAAGVVFLLDLLDGTVRIADDLEAIFRDQDIPVLGVIPALPKLPHQRHPVLVSAQAPHLASYEDLRTNLRRSPNRPEGDQHPKVVLVTSSRDQEGKTTTVMNLGIAAARAGRRVLIAECDLQHPSHGTALGLTLPPEAVASPRRYYAGYPSDPVQMVPQVESLYMALAPGPQSHAAAVLESSEMHQFLASARARFDLVLLDAPPLSRNNNAITLAAEADGLLIVSRVDYTEKPVLEAILEELLEMDDIVLLGAVVNAAPESRAVVVEASPPSPQPTVAEPVHRAPTPTPEPASPPSIDFF